MVKLTEQQLTGIMRRKENIRNIFIFAPSGQAKSSVTHALVAAAGIIAPRIAADVGGVTDTSECGQSAHVGVTDTHGGGDGLASVSGALVSDTHADDTPATHAPTSQMSIYYKMNEDALHSYTGERQGRRFLVNVIDSPQLADSATEFNADISIADGALVVVDCNEGVTLNTQRFLRQALHESIKPVLTLELMDDTCLVGSEEEEYDDDDGEQLYCRLFSIIEKSNKIVGKYENKLLGDAKFYPEKGNVSFSCCSSRLGFTLDDFAKFWAPKLKVRQSEMLERLWGDHFYNSNTKEWTYRHTGAESCHRGFVFFCLSTILQIKKFCLGGDTDTIHRLLGNIVSTRPGEKELVGKALFKHVMQTWLPAGTVLLQMMILKLPSALAAQRYRVENLYKGPLNDLYSNAIRTCDPGGPLMIYIHNMVPAAEKGKLLAFGRIFSGTLDSGMEVHVMGPTVSEHNKKYVVKSCQGAIIWIGKEQELVERVPCGNVVAISGLEQFVTTDCTLTNPKMLGAHPIRAIGLAIMSNQEIEDATLKAIAGSKEKDFTLPYPVYSSLYLHQREGIKWLWSLHCKNRGGAILADDMGLGKTRQVSSFLRGLFHSDIIKRAMVIAPSSVIDHWGPELSKVGLTSKKFTKGKDERHLTELKATAVEGGVILTTYEIFRNHENKISSELRSIDYMFADEGHRIKNYETSTSQALARIKCNHKIVVTGTPIQNNLMEFYNLMNFCCPDLLGSLEDFEANFIRLKEVVDPLVLRRTKLLLKAAGRLTSNKFEVTVWLKINPLQQKLYETLVDDDTLRLHGSALEGSKIAKGICMHPSLIVPTSDGEPCSPAKISQRLRNNLMNHLKISCPDLEPNNFTSSRIDFILYLVPKLTQNGHKILIFSKSPGMLKFIQSALGTILNEEKVIRMDGTTSRTKRLKLVESFQDMDGPSIFLMTAKVGGVGITLTAATRVLIVDPSDNPTDDNQAVDRAYRMGQEKDVVVYRFITCGTIEEHTYRQQVVKGETTCAVIEDEQCQREIVKKEGFVLCVPQQGFNASITHRELIQMHGNVFDRSLNTEIQLIKKHESVFDVFNHSAIFSQKEALLSGYHMPDNESYCRSQLPEGKGPQVKEIPKGGFAKVAFLQGRGEHKMKYVAQYSGAIVHITGTISHDFREVIVKGLSDEIREAKKLIQDIVQETRVETVFIRRDARLVCATIEDIERRSGAHVKVCEVKDDSSEQPVEIIGSAEDIETAKRMVMQVASKKLN